MAQRLEAPEPRELVLPARGLGRMQHDLLRGKEQHLPLRQQGGKILKEPDGGGIVRSDQHRRDGEAFIETRRKVGLVDLGKPDTAEGGLSLRHPPEQLVKLWDFR